VGAWRGSIPGHDTRPPAERGNFTARINGRQSLVIARANGVQRVLVICDQDNTGSRTVIEACGGQLELVEDVRGTPVRRYWID
jgi:predicted acetyltransferase